MKKINLLIVFCYIFLSCSSKDDAAIVNTVDPATVVEQDPAELLYGKWIKTTVYYNGTTPPTAEAEIDCGPDHNSYIEILSDGSYTIGENKKLFYASMLMRCKMNLLERGIYTLESVNKNSHIIALDRLEIYRYTWNDTIYPSREIFEYPVEVSEDGQQIRFYINQGDIESEIYTRASD